MNMQGKYFLSTSSHETSPKIEISEIDYDEIISARKTLSAALKIEETYDIVLGNFLDFEKEILLLTLDKVADHRFDYKKAYDVLSSINRKFTNFVLSAKNYTELIDSMTSKSANNKEDIKAIVKSMRAKHFDESLDYRFMEALRHHLSHFGGAVHLIHNPDKWLVDENNQARNFVFNMYIYSLKDRLIENEKFKKALLAELPEKIDLKKAARSYIGAISNIHQQVRTITETATTEARLTIETHLDSYKKLTDADAFMVGAYSNTAYQTDEAPTLLFLEWDDVRIELLKKNQSVSNMEKRHITSAIITE